MVNVVILFILPEVLDAFSIYLLVSCSFRFSYLYKLTAKTSYNSWIYIYLSSLRIF